MREEYVIFVGCIRKFPIGTMCLSKGKKSMD